MSDLTTRLQIQAEWLSKVSECSPDETIYGEAKNLIEQLQQRNDELTATVERLRIAALNAISIMPSGQAKADLRDAYDDTPEQNLNHVKRDCLLILARDLSSTGEIESNIIECIELYANTKYPSGKDGE